MDSQFIDIDYRPILYKIAHAILLTALVTKEGNERMSQDFSKLTTAVDKVVELVTEAIAIIKNPQTDNNSQDVIDALTIRLQSAADALTAVEPVTPAPAPEPTTDPVDEPATTDEAPADSVG